MRLLLEVAAAIAAEASVKAALSSALRHATEFLGADCGLVLVQDGGALTVLASQGDGLPVGARVPVGGVLGAVMRSPSEPVLRERIESRLRIGRHPEVAMELLLPLRLGGRAVGVLALMAEDRRALPMEDDLAVLQALATMLASVVAAPANARPRPGRRDLAATLGRLSPREQQVLALLPRGLSNLQIAEQLGIAPGTAKIHVERILHKLGVGDRTQAAVRATEWGVRS